MDKNFDNLRKLLDSFLEKGLPGFDFILYHKGECVFRHMNGYSSLEDKTPMKGDELYNIYSCSKPITATAVLMLCEKGLLSLDDRLSDYIPEFETMYIADTKTVAASTDGRWSAEDGDFSPKTNLRPAKNPIIIRDMLSMKAGFSYEYNSPSIHRCRKETDGKCPTLTAMKYFAKEPLLYEPGEGHSYSLAHDILAAVVEVVTGQKFGDFVKENIFDLCGMSRTTFLLPDEKLDEVCEQYIFNKETGAAENCGKAIQHFKFGTEHESGGAGALSTAEDYIKFLEALRCGKLISNKTLDLMTTPCTTDEQYKNALYGYGLGVRCPKAGSTATDFGWGGHAGAYLAVDRENEYSFFYAQHTVGVPGININDAVPMVREILSR